MHATKKKLQPFLGTDSPSTAFSFKLSDKNEGKEKQAETMTRDAFQKVFV